MKKYDSKTMYCGDLSKVKKNGLYGCIDINERQIIPCTYDDINIIEREYLMLTKNNKYGIADKYTSIIPCIYESIDCIKNFISSHIFYKVKLKEKYGLIDYQGNIVIPCKYQEMYTFFDQLILAKENNTWYYISETGDIKLKFSNSKYLECHNFHAGLACVENSKHKWGYIDKTGYEVIPCQFKSSSKYNSDGFCIQESNKNNILLNTKGEQIIAFKDEQISYLGEKMFSVLKSSKKHIMYNTYALYNSKGEQLTEYKFYSIGKFINNIAIVSIIQDCEDNDDGFNILYGAINAQGKEVIPCIHLQNNEDEYAYYHDDKIISMLVSDDGYLANKKLLFYDLSGKKIDMGHKVYLNKYASLNVYYNTKLKYIYFSMATFFGTLDQFIDAITNTFYNFDSMKIFYEFMNIILKYI